MKDKWLKSSNSRRGTEDNSGSPSFLSVKEERELEEKGYALVQPRKGSELYEAIENLKDRVKIYIVLKNGKKFALGHRYPIYLFQGKKSEISNSLSTLANGKKYFRKKPIQSIDNTGEPDVVSSLNEYLRVLNHPDNLRKEIQFVTFGTRGGLTITSPKDISRFETESGRTVYLVTNTGKRYQLADNPSTGFTTMSAEEFKEQYRLYMLTKKNKDYPNIEVYVNNWHNESTVLNLNEYLKQSSIYSTVVANVVDGTKTKRIILPRSLVAGFILK